MSEKPVAQFSDQEMVEWANANLERVRELEAQLDRQLTHACALDDEVEKRDRRIAELESYLDEEREKNEKQVRMTMDLRAEVERLNTLVKADGRVIDENIACIAELEAQIDTQAERMDQQLLLNGKLEAEKESFRQIAVQMGCENRLLLDQHAEVHANKAQADETIEMLQAEVERLNKRIELEVQYSENLVLSGAELEAEVDRLKREVDEREKLIIDNALLKEQVERQRDALQRIALDSANPTNEVSIAATVARDALTAVREDKA